MRGILLISTALLLTACQTAPQKESDRLFNINGKWIEISKEMQMDIRSHWAKDGEPVKVKTRIPSKKDTMWVLDTIALQSVITEKEECNKYEVMEVNPTDSLSLSKKDKQLPVGRLDETWKISLCGNIVRYRVVELSDQRGVSTYKLSP